MIDVDTPSAQEPLLDDAALRDIAAQVSARAARQLFVLDSAELLGPACAASTRTALTSIRRFVRTSEAGTRMSLVIGTRQMHLADSPAVFEEVARGYIENDLLSADSLLPLGGPRQGEALAVLREMLGLLFDLPALHPVAPEVPPRRRCTLQQALAAAHWTQVDLWEALGQSALGTQQAAQEIWHEIEPTLRRLLYRYHYRTDVDRLAAHAMRQRRSQLARSGPDSGRGCHRRSTTTAPSCTTVRT